MLISLASAHEAHTLIDFDAIALSMTLAWRITHVMSIRASSIIGLEPNTCT